MQKPFDQFAKRLFTAAWEGTGVVQTDAEILVDAQFIDLWFEPDPTRDAERATRGLVGAMGREVCGLEVFRKTPDVQEVSGCFRKQFTQHHNRMLTAKRNGQPVPPLPSVMWLLSSGHPTMGMTFVRVRRMKRWPRGFYEGGSGFLFRVVVLSELPIKRETLVLRLLATGEVRQRALRELMALPEDAWERQVATPILVDLRMLLSAEQVTYTEGSEEEQFLMTTQNLYEEWARKTRQEGYEQGEIEAKNRFEERARKLRQEGYDQGELEAKNRFEERARKLRQEGRQEGLDAGIKKGLDAGIKKGRLEGERGALTRLFAKRVGRALTEAEQQTVALRHETLGLSRLEDVALELRGEALAAWLKDPAGA